MKKSYGKYYSDESFWQKLSRYSRQAGSKVVYAGLLLYYTMKDKNVNLKTRVIILSALGYFILPTDAIPDIAPLIGFSDDLGVLLFALSQVADSLSEETRDKARKKLSEWFGEIDEEELQGIDGEVRQDE